MKAPGLSPAETSKIHTKQRITDKHTEFFQKYTFETTLT